MAFDAGTAEGKLVLDASAFDSALKKSALAIGGLVIAAKAVQGAFSAVAGFIGQGITKQAEYERSVVSLSNVLKNNGVANFKAVTAEVEEFAGALQRLTGIDDTVTIGIAQTLSNLGVQAKNLVPATKVVADFSAAFGVDTTAAARAFGQALNGNARMLAKFVPEVKNLTKAQLEAGAAFDLVGEKVKGQSEVIGNTFQGRLARLSASFDDFQKRVGEAFINAFGPLVTEVQGAIDELTDRLGGGSEGFNALQAAATATASAIRTAFLVSLEIGLRVQETYLGLKAVILQVAAALNSFVGGFIGALGGAIQQIAGLLQTLATAANAIGLTGVADSLMQVQGVAANLGQTLKEVESTQAAIATNLERSADAAGAASIRAGQFRAEISEARQSGASLATIAGIIADKFGVTANAAAGAKRSVQDMVNTTGSAGKAASAVLDLWRKVNESAQATTGSVSAAASETERAADAADEFASSMDAAAGAASRAAASASSAAMAGGGGGSGGADAFGRRSGGSTSLDFSDPFRAVTLAQQSTEARRGTGANVYTGNTLRNAAKAFADGVTSKAQAAVDRALADFSATILQELNTQGISDPTERNRILRARIAEAKRFGIIPDLTRNVTGSLVRSF